MKLNASDNAMLKTYYQKNCIILNIEFYVIRIITQSSLFLTHDILYKLIWVFKNGLQNDYS